MRKHPKCLGRWIYSVNGDDFDCDYHPDINCDECKYGVGDLDPEVPRDDQTPDMRFDGKKGWSV